MSQIVVGDTSHSAVKSGSDTESMTLSHTVASDSNILLVAIIMQENNVRNYSVTWNGNSMTKAEDASGVETQVELFYQVDPDTGTHNISATSGSSSSNAFIASIDAFVPRGASKRESDTNNGSTDPSLSLSTTGMTEALVFAGVAHTVDSARTPSNSQTEITDKSMTVGDEHSGRGLAGYKTVDGGSSTNMNWSGSNGDWAEAGMAVGYRYGGGAIVLLNL